QSRARHHDAAVLAHNERRGHVQQERLAIDVVERNAGAHLGDVALRVQRVAFDVANAESGGQLAPELRLAAAADAHDDDCADHFARSAARSNSLMYSALSLGPKPAATSIRCRSAINDVT